mmetsp:Transcript_7097/g.21598  ORF Transcript_7097/g.21598 Transcript_7097/m.21598 type:complete len:255 (-) Transcript_7097:88-852(-)
MSILSGFLSGCHSRKRRRNSFARCSFGSTFFSTVSFASTCFFAWAISGGSCTGVDCTTTAAPAAPGPCPDCGGSCALGGDLRKRLERLRLLRRRLPLEDELLEEVDFERERDFLALDRLLLERLLELLLLRLLLDLSSLDGLDHRDFPGEENLFLRLRLLLDRRRLAELLLELLREDLFGERLVAADLSDSDSSELRNFLGGGAPRQRRSFLPKWAVARPSNCTETGSRRPSRLLPRPEPILQPISLRSLTPTP